MAPCYVVVEYFSNRVDIFQLLYAFLCASVPHGLPCAFSCVCRFAVSARFSAGRRMTECVSGRVSECALGEVHRCSGPGCGGTVG